MTTTNLILLLGLLVAAALYAWVFIGARRLNAQREARVRAQAEQTAKATQTVQSPAEAPVAVLSDAPDAVLVAAPATTTAVSPFLAQPDGPPDNLGEIKGIGPKLSARLAELGVFHFRQIAAWTPDQLAAVDAQLGNFQGRPERDQWQAQARLLASGDRKAYERAHGKLASGPAAAEPPAGSTP